MYQETDLVKIAKRENNSKRNYLVVNQLQGKHIPVSPKAAFRMFGELAGKVEVAYPCERLLLVGFAETATAIGAFLAVKLNTLYMQTTREQVPDVSYLYFSESHSHATEQKLIKDDMERVLPEVDRILFVEDEVTTGNTILHIVDILEEQYPKKVRFAVASLLNGMDEQSLAVYNERNIPVHYLVKTNHSAYIEKAETYQGDGVYHQLWQTELPENITQHRCHGWLDSRRCVDAKTYQKACEDLWVQIQERYDWTRTDYVQKDKKRRSILVLGTEEFMYPALFIAAKLEDSGALIRCHSTTRSPIAVSSEEDYPVHERYELRSLYDRDRVTFIYDLGLYDKVLILTDSQDEDTYGLKTLIHALKVSGNTNIDVIRWCKA
ncbi:MAG: phosphoribosyltransferase domain-containing protein [Clostridium sp.]|nr:phosphoribosyltransferase domain-containing protein [Clostridium sp.]